VTFGATDSDNNTSSCQATVVIAYQYSGILQPINADGSSIFKSDGAVPVKFKLYCSGTVPVDTAVATLTVVKISDTITGTVEETETVHQRFADSGGVFRYNASEEQYEYNWLVKGLSDGTYRLTIDLDDGTTHEVLLSLRKK
jgi:VCBS repeat-containing protein